LVAYRIIYKCKNPIWPLYFTGNIQFQENQKDTFSYNGIIENGVQGTTQNVTKLKMTSKVEISNSKNCDFILKVSFFSANSLLVKNFSLKKSRQKVIKFLSPLFLLTEYFNRLFYRLAVFTDFFKLFFNEID